MRLFLLAMFVGLIPILSLAQLTAGFTTDKQGDCAPATIKFYNTSSGLTQNATYKWDFANVNTSTLKDPSAIFTDEGVYAVRLTVTQNGVQSVRTANITVYKKPVVSFTVKNPQVCIPSPAIFESSSAAGNGFIQSYHWDFGDGQTQQGNSATMQHAYQFPQTATVSLTAVNNFGCSETVVQPSIVKINPAIKAAFTADKLIFCDAPSIVQFSNSSTGPGVLSYSWDFGDGQTSTAQNPSHQYTGNGVYTVSLTTSNDVGCTNTSVRNQYIRVGGFTASFQLPATLCINTTVPMTNTSSPDPERNEWWIDGTQVGWTYGTSAFYHIFYVPGEHTIELKTFFGPCSSSVVKKVLVKEGAPLEGFIAEPKSLCGSPVQVDFRDTSATAIAWQWRFEQFNVQSTLQAPSYTFSYDASYTVILQTTNADGCTSVTSRQVSISRPIVGIFLEPGATTEGCTKLVVPFTFRSTEPLVSQTWSFGDQSTSTEESPVHTFNQPGDYQVTLTYKTVTGCTGTVSYWTPIRVRQQPVADFIAPPLICGNTTTYFNPAPTTGYVTSFIWDFGDNSYQQYGTNGHQYWEEGLFDVTLIAYNGVCNDTIKKAAVVKVSPPFVKINSYERTCEGTRGLIEFRDDSRQGSSWRWEFGDGEVATYNAYQPLIRHEYKATGTYKARVTVTNGACSVSDSIVVHVLLKQKPLLDLNVTNACVTNQTISITVTGLEYPPLNGYPGYSFQLYDDKGVNMGSHFNGMTYSQPWVFNLNGFAAGEYRLRVITNTYYYGCNDTSNYITLVVKGPAAAIGVDQSEACFKTALLFKDLSKAVNNVALKSAYWDFGDGFNQSSTPGATVSHTYANPGTYQVTLRETDEGGCYSEAWTIVTITGPKASFVMSPSSPVQLSSNVDFINTSNTAGAYMVTWQWSVNETIVSPSHSFSQLFPVAGTYTVRLVGVNAPNGCRDTSTQVLTVNDFRTGFSSDLSFIGDHGTCPPVIARFRNTSVNYTRLVWDFGDGQVLEDQYAPTHIYSEPGDYYVTLKIYGYNGLQETQYDTVHVTRPAALLTLADTEACPGDKLELHASLSERVKSFHWDFGNGSVSATTDSFAIQSFPDPGTFLPALLVKDANGCEFAVRGEPIIVHPSPIAAISPAAAVICKGQPAELTATGGLSYQWSPVAGLNTSTGTTVAALPTVATTYQVRVTDQHGCKDSAKALVKIAEPVELKGSPETDLCKGSSIQLNVTGAQGIRWIGNTAGLDNPSIASPIATPSADVTYMAVGSDIDQCYTDTHYVKINVRPIPVVNAGADLQVLYGSENRLAASGSTDVVKWNWSPSQYLSCINCATTVSRPFDDMLYVVTGTTSYGCVARDSVRVKAACAETNIFIPTAFSPNGDGNNDVLTISGFGVSRIRSFRIFNRWGNLILEHKNFLPGDQGKSWNGIYKGLQAPAGAYVYIAELDCTGGELFTRKGTFMLIR